MEYIFHVYLGNFYLNFKSHYIHLKFFIYNFCNLKNSNVFEKD